MRIVLSYLGSLKNMLKYYVLRCLVHDLEYLCTFGKLILLIRVNIMFKNIQNIDLVPCLISQI